MVSKNAKAILAIGGGLTAYYLFRPQDPNESLGGGVSGIFPDSFDSPQSDLSKALSSFGQSVFPSSPTGTIEQQSLTESKKSVSATEGNFTPINANFSTLSGTQVYVPPPNNTQAIINRSSSTGGISKLSGGTALVTPSGVEVGSASPPSESGSKKSSKSTPSPTSSSSNANFSPSTGGSAYSPPPASSSSSSSSSTSKKKKRFFFF